MAQPFDLEKLRTTGEIFPLAEPVVQFSASDSGTLAYVSGVIDVSSGTGLDGPNRQGA